MRTILALTLATTMSLAAQTTIPEGYWSEARSGEILAKTETIRLAPDLSHLTAAEQLALKDLIQAGLIMQKLYEHSRHHEALAAFDKLRVLDVQSGRMKRTANLLDLYRLNQGPIATTLGNERQPFLPVAPEVKGRNVYPLDATREEIDAFLEKNPSMRSSILAERTVVRRMTAANLAKDIGSLQAFHLVRLLQHGLLDELRALARNPDPKSFYAVPYAVAYAEELFQAYQYLMRAASRLETEDPEFARYLRHRARDLMSNDYESGDASWVTGRFDRLNAQIGAYETYDDALYGVKAFHGMSILAVNQKATAELRSALGGIQAIEDALPYEAKKKVREDISVAVYDVIADFGQARGTNTATILPNDAGHSRRYGRTILLRENIMTHPSIFAADERVWRAAIADAHASDLKPVGNFQRTLWHEIGHYLGVDRTSDGRTLDAALEEYASSLEEMKSDLVSLFALHRMNHESLRAIQASGIRRTLQNVKPRPDQPYQMMQLAQFNWFLDKGLITADPQTARLTIHYEKFPEAVSSLLEEVLALQRNGDKAAAAAFYAKWNTWRPELHDKLAARIREAQGARWRLVRYAALGE